MQAAALLASNKNPTRDEIVAHMDGNICRCGTYLRIISAIQRAAREG
jgi:isoquinoline 1-oxidoreductase subunit alpha